MDEPPLAYFLTWTCYGTWLPGDDRGWTKWHKGMLLPQPLLAAWCLGKMAETPVMLDEVQRELVEATINEHCGIRSWHLHAANCRSNHCHCVVTAPDYDGEQVRDQFKSWCKRKLKEHQLSGAAPAARSNDVAPNRTARAVPLREHWWTAKGSVRHLYDEESLEAAIAYTLAAQDLGGSQATY